MTVPIEKCSVTGCERTVDVKASGLCGMHYQRLWKHGDVSVSKRTYRGPSADGPGNYICRTCGIEKPLTEFHRRGGERRRTDCKVCCRIRARESGARVKKGDERWLIRRNGILRRKYGITLEDFAIMRDRQEGRCALCGSTPKLLHVDHCHTTGRVRALLCIRCNTALGWIEGVMAGDIARIAAYARLGFPEP